MGSQGNLLVSFCLLLPPSGSFGVVGTLNLEQLGPLLQEKEDSFA